MNIETLMVSKSKNVRFTDIRKNVDVLARATNVHDVLRSSNTRLGLLASGTGEKHYSASKLSPGFVEVVISAVRSDAEVGEFTIQFSFESEIGFFSDQVEGIMTDTSSTILIPLCVYAENSKFASYPDIVNNVLVDVVHPNNCNVTCSNVSYLEVA